jgi:DNA-binding ferritin-like protein (Dps family)
MGIHDLIDGKKQWRAHMARVKALPPDYQIVYEEMQRYFFEESAAAGTGVRELLGYDVAAFCDGLIEGSPTYAELFQQSISGERGTPEK